MTDQNKTVHSRARTLLDIYGYRAIGTERRRVMREIAKRAVAEADDRPDVPRLDFREWRRDWDWSMPLMIGSGRRSEWCHAMYRWRAHVALVLHQDLGWSGQRVRDMANWLSRRHGCGGWSLPKSIPDSIPVDHANSLYRRATAKELASHQHAIRCYMRETPCDSTLAIVAADWGLWLQTVFQRSWGRQELAREVYRMEHDASVRASSLATGSIRAWRGVDHTTDYRGCSGCEWIAALHDRPDLWDYFLAREVSHVRGKLGPLDAVAAPHGVPIPDEFDHCVIFGLNAAVYVRKRDFDAHGSAYPHDLVWNRCFEASS